MSEAKEATISPIDHRVDHVRQGTRADFSLEKIQNILDDQRNTDQRFRRISNSKFNHGPPLRKRVEQRDDENEQRLWSTMDAILIAPHRRAKRRARFIQQKEETERQDIRG